MAVLGAPTTEELILLQRPHQRTLLRMQAYATLSNALELRLQVCIQTQPSRELLLRSRPQSSGGVCMPAPENEYLICAQSGAGGLKGRAEQLDLKEKELNAREAELARKEEELRKAGALVPKKNWPICYPILHHDIAGDVWPC